MRPGERSPTRAVPSGIIVSPTGAVRYVATTLWSMGLPEPLEDPLAPGTPGPPPGPATPPFPPGPDGTGMIGLACAPGAPPTPNRGLGSQVGGDDPRTS